MTASTQDMVTVPVEQFADVVRSAGNSGLRVVVDAITEDNEMQYWLVERFEEPSADVAENFGKQCSF
jgi:hypothetical protein